MFTTPTLLRIASIITFIYFAGHTAGMPWTPAVGPLDRVVIDGMKADTFNAAGATRTYWDFYFGFGVAISLFLLAQAVVLWQLAGLARTNARSVGAITAAFLVAFIANGIVAWRFFFAVPAVLAGLVALCLALALVASRRAG
jgi:hypothetical protein